MTREPPDRRSVLTGLGAAVALCTKPTDWCHTGKADRVLVMKTARRLSLWRGGVYLVSYPIALGGHPHGAKRWRGDGRTPEGTYLIDGRNAHSRYFLSLHISYPNPSDVAAARAAHRDPGADIFIHGLPDWAQSMRPEAYLIDWTDGCIAVGDKAMEDLWTRVDDGTPIEIRA